tara:strand:+ start:367 stop:501 length:135 start_codon:yes stop_codon:yes gene_type:complete
MAAAGNDTTSAVLGPNSTSPPKFPAIGKSDMRGVNINDLGDKCV